MIWLASAVFTSAALIWSPFHVGCACLTSAAVPDVIGQAIEVPDSTEPAVPPPTSADVTLTPGAVISGFAAESPTRGPPDVKLALCL